MDRRHFLALSAAGATAAALGSWLTAHAGEEDTPPKQTPKEDPLDKLPASARLKSAYRVARDTGRPMLVFLDPTIDPPYKTDKERATVRQAHEFGAALGVTINNGDDALFADMAMCEVVCARTHDLAHIAPTAANVGQPMMILIEARDKSASASAIDIELGEAPSVMRGMNGKDYKTAVADAEKAVKARVAKISEAIRDALAKNLVMLETRATRNAQALGKGRVKRISAALRSGEDLPAVDVLSAAPTIRLLAEKATKGKELLIQRLAAARIPTLKEKPPAGAKWANSWGCGTTIEGESDGSPGYACGMGHVAPLSQRFLIYYTK